MIKKIKEFLKKILAKSSNDPNVIYYINNPDITYINWNLVSQLEKYDIVYVKMDTQHIANVKNVIPLDHQTRPFLIENINNKTNTIDGYYTTSNLNCCRFLSPNKKRYKIFLSAESNNPNKKSLVLIDKKISLPYENIKRKMRHIDTNELSIFQKKLATYNKREIISNDQNKIIDVGDIIYNNYKNYYIYQKDNTFSYGYNIIFIRKYLNTSKDNELLKNPLYILIAPNIFKIDYTLRKQFSNSESITINDISNVETIYEVEAKKKQYKKENKMRH